MGTNNKATMLALKLILLLAIEKVIHSLYLHKDSLNIL